METILTDSEFEILINEFYSKKKLKSKANLKPTKQSLRKSLRKKSVRT